MTSNNGTPIACVVVPTFDRAHRLPALLRALGDQDGVVHYEVVIVDDCSTDDTQAVIAQLAADAPVPVRVMRTTRNAGPATARNLGWRQAAAPVVAFTDDDCLPDRGWLASLVAATTHADVVQGRTVPPDGVQRTAFSRRMLIEEWSDLFETCNMAYRREVLERLGGFDEAFRRPFGEDTDLGWRAVEAGATAVFEPAATVVHPIEHDTHLRDFVAELRGHSRKVWTARALKKHPPLRRRFFRKWFYMAHHPRTIAVIVAMVLAAAGAGGRWRWLLAALAWIPYVRFRVAVDPRPCQRQNLVPVLLLGVVSDVAEVGAVVVGSIRFRTLLL